MFHYDLARHPACSGNVDMRINIAAASALVACALTMVSCSGSSTPSSPSVVSPRAAAGGSGLLRPLDDPPAPVPDPSVPMPDPNVPAPLAVIINIVGSFGANAFMPNPTKANMGDQIVFANTDMRVHHIVLDDGTDLGEVQPGQSSVPMPLTTPTATFHCTIHPTMVGAINGELAPPPYVPPPPDDYYGYYRRKDY